ncbi:hypothetical protein Gotri_006845 [Gossypium trilobum]|uniref:GRAM domain-containing protein n=1 Tax=Gossypium trilobum TaxID=34281 RepID=A0A7J9FMR7_9ROSI|nr:hypothetical protein [Gossypium trilobum]
MNKLGKKADTFAHGLREHVGIILHLQFSFCCILILVQVLIPLEKIKGVKESENMKKTSQKYMEIVTVDDYFQFWFMGFLNYHKAFKYLQQAIISQRLLHDVLQVTFKVAHYVSL